MLVRRFSTKFGHFFSDSFIPFDLNLKAYTNPTLFIREKYKKVLKLSVVCNMVS
jgi:hypothetical protein